MTLIAPILDPKAWKVIGHAAKRYGVEDIAVFKRYGRSPAERAAREQVMADLADLRDGDGKPVFLIAQIANWFDCSRETVNLSRKRAGGQLRAQGPKRERPGTKNGAG